MSVISADRRIDPYAPPEMAARAESVGVAKANARSLNTFLLGILAGAFVALGAEFATVVSTDTGLGYGPARLIAGLAFSLGLLLVVVAGAELFTGSVLIVMAWAGGRVSSRQILRNWLLVYLGNFVGSIATAGFVASSFAHSVANMYFIPFGILLKDRPEIVQAAGNPAGLANLTRIGFLLRNLLPVTLGNIVGSAVLVGGFYWLVYLRSAKPSSSPAPVDGQLPQHTPHLSRQQHNGDLEGV